MFVDEGGKRIITISYSIKVNIDILQDARDAKHTRIEDIATPSTL